MQVVGGNIMKRLAMFASSAAIVALFAGLAYAAEVKTDYDHSADFSQVHTYSWGQVSTTDPFYVDRIKQEVDKDLQAKGWQMVPSGGDVTVFAKGNVHNQQELETYYNGFGGGWGGRWGWGGWGGPWNTTTAVTNQKVGMLVVDIFNGHSKNLMWRGSAEADLSKSEEKNTSSLDKDIDKMFKDFPPKRH
jgi:hypothetical protein